MIASLGMYDRAETAAANDRYWVLIRNGLRAREITAPYHLTRGDGAYWPAWQSGDLVLSQTCGFPYRARLHEQVALIGTPDFGIQGCPSGYYRSVLVTRADDPRQDLTGFDGAALAYNECLSQSGWAAPMNHASALGLRLFAGPVTGGHRLSAMAVAEGRADLAAIDAVTWAMLTRWDISWVKALRVVAMTDPTPGLPYIAAKGSDAGAIFAAIADAITELLPADRDILMLQGVVHIPPEAYLSVPTPPAPEQ